MDDLIPTYGNEPILDHTWTQRDSLDGGDAEGAGEDGMEMEGQTDDEWEEDEISYITLDFGRYVKPDGLRQLSSMQLLALNSPQPFAKAGSSIFQGQHEHLIGSEILLQRDRTDGTLTPFTTTSHRILLTEVTLRPVDNDNPDLAPSALNDLGIKTKKGKRDPMAPKKKPGRKPKPKPEQPEDGETSPQPKRRGRPPKKRENAQPGVAGLEQPAADGTDQEPTPVATGSGTSH